MLQNVITRLKVFVQLVTIFSGACLVLLLSSCFDAGIPAQDANIHIYADQPASRGLIKLDTAAMYDTIASTLECALYFDSLHLAPQNMNACLQSKFKESRSVIDSTGISNLGWITGGEYNLIIGTPGKYPCFFIHHLHIPSGTKCILHLYKTAQP